MTETELIQLIVREVVATLQALPGEKGKFLPSKEDGTIPIGVSVRHVHLCRGDLEILFGPGYELQVRNELYQPNSYAAQETVTLVTPSRVLHNVRILLPLRQQTQVELAHSDAIFLGLNPPIVLSGQSLKGSVGIVLVGPAGAVDLKEGVIIAARHVHASPADVARWGVRDGDQIDVAIDGPRAMILRYVVVRVGENSRLEMHLDTDEANAACVTCGVTARFVGLTEGTGKGGATGEGTSPQVRVPGARRGPLPPLPKEEPSQQSLGPRGGNLKTPRRAVLTAQDVEEAEGEVVVEAQGIITPLAWDVARKRGVVIRREAE